MISSFFHPRTLLPSLLLAAASVAPVSGLAQLPSGPQADGPFRKVILEADKMINGQPGDTIKDPMELSVSSDGRVFYAEREGVIKMWNPQTQASTIIATIPVFTTGGRSLEDGMLGLTLDPAFEKNNWIYLNHSLPETTTDAQGRKVGIIRVSRYTLTGDKLDPASEKRIIDITTQRDECCHVGGSLAFDGAGNLFISVGDNTNPFASDGFAPIDERPGRSAWDAQKSSSNANDLRGKILRITPKAEGGYSIPKGNLFPEGTEGTRPEVYAMGNRNPFRISVDKQNGILYWGDVGPDAGQPKEGRGPAGYDEINQARSAGFFGWPYFIADNRAYNHFNFNATNSGVNFVAASPLNESPNNTGIRNLPPAQPAFIFYAHFPSTRFPVVNAGGGRTAMAGPVYRFDPNLRSPTKLPKEYDNTLFIYEWSRNWIIAVHLDANNQIAKMERFCPGMTFRRPMDMELGPDGCLYLIEFGTAWGGNKDTQIVRIEHVGQPN